MDNSKIKGDKNGESYLERMEEGTGGGLQGCLRISHRTEDETICCGVRYTEEPKESTIERRVKQIDKSAK